MKNDCPGIRYKQAAWLVLCFVAFANGGCLWVAAGVAGGAAAGYAYCKGKVCETYNASFTDTWTAAHTALQEFGMQVVKEEQHGMTGFIESRTGDGERVRIYLDAQQSKIPVEGGLMRVCVRVATFGDRPFSDRFLDQVGFHLTPPPLLGAPPPSATLEGIHPATSTTPGPSPRETAPPPLLPPDTQVPR